MGHNERYIKIALVSEKDLTNQIVPVVVQENLTEKIMFGKINQ